MRNKSRHPNADGSLCVSRIDDWFANVLYETLNAVLAPMASGWPLHGRRRRRPPRRPSETKQPDVEKPASTLKTHATPQLHEISPSLTDPRNATSPRHNGPNSHPEHNCHVSPASYKKETGGDAIGRHPPIRGTPERTWYRSVKKGNNCTQ